MEILLVDDERRASEALEEFFEGRHQVKICENGQQALDLLKDKQFDLVITDHQMPQVTGLELIEQGKKLYPQTFFIMVTAHSSTEHAIEALRKGADDYLMKPINFEELELRVNRVEELIGWRNQKVLSNHQSSAMDNIIGQSASVKELKSFIQKASQVHSPVLIHGPSGAGKELFAKAVHESGKYNKYPFIAINCASLSEQLLESELFGHEKGAFTGATQNKPGKFELARQGTLFLDEIGELAPNLQAKLLRVLQEKEFYRVGGTRLIKSECRILAATHKPLETMVQEGHFREDLFFRLNILNYTLPSLDQRKEDIPLLTKHFWQQLCKEFNVDMTLGDSFIHSLQEKSYPGNIRQLRNEIERALVFNIGKPSLSAHDIDSTASSPTQKAPKNLENIELGLSVLVENLEKEVIAQAMKETNYNQVKAAKRLQITRGALQYKLNKYNITKSQAA